MRDPTGQGSPVSQANTVVGRPLSRLGRRNVQGPIGLLHDDVMGRREWCPPGLQRLKKADRPEEETSSQSAEAGPPVRRATCREGSPWHRGGQARGQPPPPCPAAASRCRWGHRTSRWISPGEHFCGVHTGHPCNARTWGPQRRSHGQDSEAANLKHYRSDGLWSSRAVKEGFRPSSIKFTSALH